MARSTCSTSQDKAELGLEARGAPLDARGFSGVRLLVWGNGEEYLIHLRTRDTRLPWQLYRTPFVAEPTWQTVELTSAEQEATMTIKRVYDWLYHGRRPNWLARGLNQFWAVVHALGVAPNYLVTLQVLGRRSGKLITFPLVMAVVDGERYLVSMLGPDVAWVRNLPATGFRVLLRHGRTEIVQLEGIPVAQRGRILQSYARRAPGARPHLPVAVDAPLAAFEAVAAQLPVFRVRTAEQGA